ncbi:MAG: hypothetical protein GY906_21560 [bacterium]|nr:hypothetical protein [bacterium]
MLRVLLLSDTHLGFDLPIRPRVERRRRGPDFFDNTRRALAPARAGIVDLVVHGGDLLYRSKVPASLVQAALEPLLEVAECGLPVVFVPGNHERSSLPYPLLAAHENLHVLESPRSIELNLVGHDLAIAGFPCEREPSGGRFHSLVAATGAQDLHCDIRLLCIHQAVEGATVGPSNFTFRYGRDVVPGHDIPSHFAAILSGHIHRMQVLEQDLAGRDLAAPVFYPGSVERTSFAERDEAKGSILLEIMPDASKGGRVASWEFSELPTRPMKIVTIPVNGADAGIVARRIEDELAALDPNAIVQLRLKGTLQPGAQEALHAARLRSLHPVTMNVSVRGWRSRTKS